MKTLTALALAALGVAQAQVIVECDGGLFPNWDGCLSIAEDLGWENSGEYLYRQGDDDFECYQWVFPDHKTNCMLAYCFTDVSASGIAESAMFSSLKFVEEKCRAARAGGKAETQGFGYFEVTFDPDFIPDSDSKRMRRRGVASMPAMQLSGHKRQTEDDTWISTEIYRSIRNENVKELVADRATPGVTFTWENSEGHSVSIETTAGLEAGPWGLFTASVSLSVGYEETYTYSEGLQVTPNCNSNQVGEIYYYPLFDRYVGYWASDPGTEHSVWVALENGGKVRGEFDTRCLGRVRPEEE